MQRSKEEKQKLTKKNRGLIKRRKIPHTPKWHHQTQCRARCTPSVAGTLILGEWIHVAWYSRGGHPQTLTRAHSHSPEGASLRRGHNAWWWCKKRRGGLVEKNLKDWKSQGDINNKE